MVDISYNHSYVQNSFLPQIAVICSPFAGQITQKNNLTFDELLLPFCTLKHEINFHPSPTNQTKINNLKVSFVDVNYKPPPAVIARKYLSNAVSNQQETNIVTIKSKLAYELQVPATTPWFDEWRKTFLKVQYPSDHEFINHFLAVCIVISINELKIQEKINELDATITRLHEYQLGKIPKWFSSNTLRYYVILHDKSTEINAQERKNYDSICTLYGADKCYLLSINSKLPNAPCVDSVNDLWSPILGWQLSTPDEDNLSINASEASFLSPSGSMYNFAESPTSSDGRGSVAIHPLSPRDTPDLIANFANIENANEALDTNMIRSVSAGQIPIIRGACLTNIDLESVEKFIEEFCSKALIPHVEKEIARLSELIAVKRGVSRSLLSATKRWFGTNKPGTVPMPTNVTYNLDSIELQSRRLGDLYFMFFQYQQAFHVYQSVKRDFYADQAWLYYAGALEMTAISGFLLQDFSRKILDYIEEAISTYLVSCRMPQFATRATLISYECLKMVQYNSEAAKHLIRMTSEDSDLRSALLLEQAAYCFLNSDRQSMIRKYAFHIVLAGHRFSKAGQRNHSLRCYKQARQVYNDRHWSLAEDHINFIIGRQAANLFYIEEAINSFSKLLFQGSKQIVNQQYQFFKELLTVYSQKETSDELPILSLPQIITKEIKLNICASDEKLIEKNGKLNAKSPTIHKSVEEITSSKWKRLEEILYSEATKNSSYSLFKPSIPVYTKLTNNSMKPIGVVGEIINVSIEINNPLKMSLNLTNLKILWSFTTDDTMLTNDLIHFEDTKNEYVYQNIIDLVILKPESNEDVMFALKPLKIGNLKIKGLAYTLNIFEEYSKNQPSLSVTGKQLIYEKDLVSIKVESSKNKPPPDYRLEIDVIDTVPCLQVLFSDISLEVLAGEIIEMDVELHNIGQQTLENIYVISNLQQSIIWSLNKPFIDPQLPFKERIRKEFVDSIKLPNDGVLLPAASHSFKIWFKVPDYQRGLYSVDVMFYYENVDKNSKLKYRILRHSWNFIIQESINEFCDISLSESTLQSNDKLNICLQITNANRLYHQVVSEISVEQLSLLSDNWSLNSAIYPTLDNYISMNETIDCIVCAMKINKTNKIITHTKLKNTKFDTKKLLFEQDAYLNFIYRSENLDNFTIDDNEETAMIKKNKQKWIKTSGILAIFWVANISRNGDNARKAIGIRLLHLEQIPTLAENDAFFMKFYDISKSFEMNKAKDELKHRIESRKLEEKHKQLKYTLSFDSVVRHDFNKNRLCLVPVVLSLHSYSDDKLTVKINLMPKQSLNVTQDILMNQSDILTTMNFRWVGACGGSTIEIEPHSFAQVNLKACILQQGVYNLSSGIEIYSINSSDSSKDYLPQLWSVFTPLIVTI